MIDYSHFTCNSVIYGFGVYAHKPKLQQWKGIKGSAKGENTNKGLYPKNSPSVVSEKKSLSHHNHKRYILGKYIH